MMGPMQARMWALEKAIDLLNKGHDAGGRSVMQLATDIYNWVGREAPDVADH